MIQLKNPKFFLFIALGAGLFGLVLWYFAGSNVSVQYEPPTTSASLTPTPQAQGGAVSLIQKFTVQGNEFSLSPKILHVKRGSKVELTFENIGSVPHNYTVSDLNIATKTIGGGKSDTVTFTAPNTPGTVTYDSYCSVFGHRQAGMKGSLVVE